MSKRDLKAYLKDLDKAALEEQILDLYGRFKEVRTFYNFAFNPSEDKLLGDALFRIKKEYFPENGRKSKKRRSVAQKLIRHFVRLEADPNMIAEVMFVNIEIAQQYCREHPVKQEAFYISMLKSFEEMISFLRDQGDYERYSERIQSIVRETTEQEWFNSEAFRRQTQH